MFTDPWELKVRWSGLLALMDSEDHDGGGGGQRVAYWVLSLGLVVFGLLAGFSIGQPFFLVGLTMILLGAFRQRPLVFWPPILAVIAYNITYWAIAPLGCNWTVGSAGVGRTVCSNLIGLPYAGEGIYNPSLRPAVAAGLVVASIVFLLTVTTLLWLRRRGNATPVPDG